MKKTLTCIISVVVALSVLIAIAAVPASAAVSAPASSAPLSAMTVTGANKDIYLRIDGIEGESKNASHDKWIDIIYFKHGAANSGQTGNGEFEPVVFKHLVDKATPKLQEACMKGNNITTAQVDFCRAIAGKQSVVYSVKLEDIKVIKAEVEVVELEDGNYQLVETVELLVNKQTWTAIMIGLDNTQSGSVEAGFDQTKKS